MTASNRFDHPETPFPVGVEYYRAPTPKTECWDEDFARISSSGFRVVRSFTYWNWMEPSKGNYELDDIDLLFELTAKHGLSVWLDIVLATHGACPEWLTNEFPDMRVVNYRGERVMPDAHPAYPQGAMIHCYDHPAWKKYGGALLRHVVSRYKDHENMLIWGLWDGIGLPSAWTDMGGGYPCYCDNTLKKYNSWLRKNFTLDSFNDRVQRRYKSWDEIEPPRSNENVVEMLLYREFNYRNLANSLKWVVDETANIDPVHEKRSHGGWVPRPHDEYCALIVDSWGMSMNSNHLLTSDYPYELIADRSFAFEWSRSIAKNHRWWNEEIYAGMSPAGLNWQKQSEPQELTMLLWMTLASGASGSMFWQYRPEYLSFESPGYNLVALDGKPTPRFEAVTEAIAQIESMSQHLPLAYQKPDIGIICHPETQDLFGLSNETAKYLSDLRGIYRTLWRESIPADILTPKMSWSGYRLLFLPNTALMTDELNDRIIQTLKENPETKLVTEGAFGMYSSNGMSSYSPPESLGDIFGVRVADISRVTEKDIATGNNRIQTSFGDHVVTSPRGYLVLQPTGKDTEEIATLNGECVAVRTSDGRFTWYGIPLSGEDLYGFSSIAKGHGEAADTRIVLGEVSRAGIEIPISIQGDKVVSAVRISRQGGHLVFLFNLEPKTAEVVLMPGWKISAATDLITNSSVPISNNSLKTSIQPWGVGVLHFVRA